RPGGPSTLGSVPAADLPELLETRVADVTTGANELGRSNLYVDWPDPATRAWRSGASDAQHRAHQRRLVRAARRHLPTICAAAGLPAGTLDRARWMPKAGC